MDKTTTAMVPNEVSEVQIYEHPAFGQVRMIVENGKWLTCALDAAKALQYANPYDALDLHCRSLAKREVPHPQSKTKTIEMNFIPDGDLYRLIARSHMPGAEAFESWIFDDIVPTVVDTGTYTAKPVSPAELALLQAQALVDLERKQTEQQAALETVTTRLDNIGDIISLSPTVWREDCRKMIVRIAEALGGFGFIKDVTSEIYKLMRERFGIDLEARLRNMRRRAAEEGVSESRRNKLTKVDAIAQDKRAIEAYVLLIKEMAIKYGLDKARPE